MDLISWHKYFQKSLKEKHSERAITSFFKHLLKSFFDWEPTTLGLSPNKMLETAQEEKLKSALQDLLADKPLQYIVGFSDFMELQLEVTPATLIPRPETEELVSWVLEDYKDSLIEIAVIDVCTGSGAIALALKHQRPHWQIDGYDVSSEALEVAERNATNLQLAVYFGILDLTINKSSLPKCDLIVSNPPYVNPDEKTEMEFNVLDYEPHLALFTPNDDPLFYYEKLFVLAQKSLQASGRLYLEINPKYCEELKRMALSYDCKNVESRMDIFGKQRMLCCHF